MSDVKKRCAACRKEKPVSEMKVCMHSQMHYYVCDSKCMHDFYNPPKAEKTGHDAIIAALQSTLSAAETERDQLRAELEAIRGQQSDAVSVPSYTALRRAAKFLAGIDNGCNEVKTLRALVANAQVGKAVSDDELDALWREIQDTAMREPGHPHIRFARALLSTKNAEEGQPCDK